MEGDLSIFSLLKPTVAKLDLSKCWTSNDTEKLESRRAIKMLKASERITYKERLKRWSFLNPPKKNRQMTMGCLSRATKMVKGLQGIDVWGAAEAPEQSRLRGDLMAAFAGLVEGQVRFSMAWQHGDMKVPDTDPSSLAVLGSTSSASYFTEVLWKQASIIDLLLTQFYFKLWNRK